MQEMVYDDTRWVRRLQLLSCWDEVEARRRRAETLKGQFEKGHGKTEGSISNSDTVIRREEEGKDTVNGGGDGGEVPSDSQHGNGAVEGAGVKDIRDGFDGIDLSATPDAQSSPAATKNKDAVARLSVLKTVRSVRGQARREFGRVYAALAPFYRDAVSVSNHTHAKVFRTYRDPEQQAIMLSNMLRYNECDLETAWVERKEKLLKLIGAFETAVMKEFEVGLREGDVKGRMTKYARVLCALDGGKKAVEMVLERSEVIQNKERLGDPIYCLDGMGDYQYEKSFNFFQNLGRGVLEQVEILDTVFPRSVDTVIPYLWRVGKEVIMNFLNKLFHEAHRTYVDSYLKAVGATCEQCLNWVNAMRPEWIDRDAYDKAAEEMIVAIFDPHVDLYLTEELAWFKNKVESEVSEWERQLSEQDASMESMYMSNVNRQADKRDFLSSFKKVVMMPVNVLPTFQSKPAAAKALVNGERLAPGSQQPSRSASPALVNGTAVTVNRPVSPLSEAPTTELAAKAAIMKSRLEGIRSLFSIEVALNLVHAAKSSIERAVVFSKLESRFAKDAQLQCELIFITLLQTLGGRHVQPGFDQAIDHLSKYNPREVNEDRQAGMTPLVTFLELVNVGDLIQQMVEVFYEQELVAAKLTDRNDFLNPAVKEKKRFEQMLDTRVAAGLNKGIEVLMDEIEHVLATTQKIDDFNPGAAAPSSTSSSSISNNNRIENVTEIGATPTAVQVVDIVSSHTKMLLGSTEKNMLDVFNQEVGMRLFTALCKHLKRQRVSTAGSLRLISDMGLYHSYVVTLRNRDLLQFFIALRELSQIYLIDPGDAKALAAIIADGDRFKGIFRAEEVYEYAERRADWYAIRGKVERAMYGIGCVVM